jgi:hypothetical protein
MNDSIIDYMLSQREDLRREEHELTQKIKIERSRRYKLNKNKSASQKNTRHYLELRTENKNLKQMIAVLAKATYLTNLKVGEMLDVSPVRAAAILRMSLEDLGFKYKI